MTVCSLPLYWSVCRLPWYADTFLAVSVHTNFSYCPSRGLQYVFAGSLSAYPRDVILATLVPLSPDTTVMSVPSKPSGTKVCSSPLYSSVPPVGTATIFWLLRTLSLRATYRGLGASSGAHAESDPLLKPTLLRIRRTPFRTFRRLYLHIICNKPSPNSKLTYSPVILVALPSVRYYGLTIEVLGRVRQWYLLPSLNA